jgi:TolA-binding protein
MKPRQAQWLLAGLCLLIVWGCGKDGELSQLDADFRAAMLAGDVSEAYAILGRLEARGPAARSSITPAEKAECYLASAEKLIPQDYDRALEMAEMTREAFRQVEQTGEPIPPALDQRFTSLYRALVAAAPGNIPRPELRKVTFSEDFPETLMVDRTRPIDTQILELLMTEGLARLEERNRQLEDQNQELRDRMEEITGPIADLDERLKQVSDRLKGLDEAEQDVDQLEGNVSQIAAEAHALKKELHQTIQDLETLKSAHGGTAAEVQEIQSRLVQVVGRAEQIEQRIERVDVRLAKFEQGVMVSNLFRDGVAAYDRGEYRVAEEKLVSYLDRVPEEDPKVPEASAMVGLIYVQRVEDVIDQEQWKTSKRDVERARKNLSDARGMLSTAQERLNQISAERLREAVKRELSRIDNYERRLARL